MAESKDNEPTVPQQEIKVTVTPEQMQFAAAAGVNLLSDPELKVPMNAAAQLNLLRDLLNAVAQGTLVLVGAEDAKKLDNKTRRPPAKKRAASRGKGRN